jgi:cyclopropane fatty-acyl-phospholipid synthase-like methyltransferase
VQNLFRRLLFQYWYFSQPPWDTGISPPELLEFMENHNPGRAIDIGCGTGTNVITLARSGWQVTGVDFAPRAINLAKQKLKKEGLQADVSVNDATKLDGITGPFNLALDIGCFHAISKDGQRKYLYQLDRVLAPSGFWLMYGFFKPSTLHSGRFDTLSAASGVDEADVSRISPQMTLLSRRDGFDKRERPSAWFLYQKQP